MLLSWTLWWRRSAGEAFRRLPSTQMSKTIGHADIDMPGMSSRVVAREDERIGLAHALDGDGRDARPEGPVHGLDEFIGDDGVTGVGRINAIPREKSSHEAGGQLLTSTQHHAR